MSLLLPDLYTDKSVIYELDETSCCCSWDSNILAIGTSRGSISIFTPSSLKPSELQTLSSSLQRDHVYEKHTIDVSSAINGAVNFVKLSRRYLVAGSLASGKIVVVSHVQQKKKTSSSLSLQELEHTVLTYPHSGFINSIDVNDDGVVAVTGDDRHVTVFDDPVCEISLENIGLKCKFVTVQSRECLMILEATNVITIVDWKNNITVASLYPVAHDSYYAVPEIADFYFDSAANQVVVLGSSGWLKRYDLQSIRGNGYTQESSKQTILGFVNPVTNQAYIAVSKSDVVVANITSHKLLWTDFRSETPKVVKLALPTAEISSCEIGNGVVCITCGTKLLLVVLTGSSESNPNTR